MLFDLKATARQRATLLIEGGLTITFTSSPALNGTYALDNVTVSQIKGVANDAASGLGLVFDAPIFVYPDKNGDNKSFNSDQIQTLYKALRDFTALVEYYGTGQIPTAPTPTVTVD